MKHLLAMMALCVAFAAGAQTVWPIPYNPDEDMDGIIGTPDLLGLLSLYGAEFSTATVSDDEQSAMLFMGNMAYPPCVQSCRNLPGMWSLPTIENLGLVWSEVNATQQYEYLYTWLESSAKQAADQVSMYYRSDVTNGADKRVEVTSDINESFKCYCSIKELPEVEYTYCSGSGISGCAENLVQDGWYPISGITTHAGGGSLVQAFWRWAE